MSNVNRVTRENTLRALNGLGHDTVNTRNGDLVLGVSQTTVVVNECGHVEFGPMTLTREQALAVLEALGQ